MSENRTSERILDVAERLLQTRGFNDFSYADIGMELGITTASLHYHFGGKAEMGHALVTRYAQRFGDALDRIDREVPGARGKLEAYADLYLGLLESERMCLCGVLAAEYETLPASMHRAVIGFFDENQRWLAGVVNQGQTEKTLAFTGSADEVAQRILSTLEGAMLVARPYCDPTKFTVTARQLLADLAK